MLFSSFHVFPIMVAIHAGVQINFCQFLANYSSSVFTKNTIYQLIYFCGIHIRGENWPLSYRDEANIEIQC